MSQILIDSHAYRLISAYKTTRKNTLPSHPLEDAETYTDHINVGSPAFDISLILFEGEYEILDALACSQRLVTVVMPAGYYNNCAIKNLSNASNNSNNTTSASITIEVQRITRTEIRATELDGISAVSSDASGLTATAVVEDFEALTTNQLKEYYLSKLNPFAAASEREKLDNMTDLEIADYLVKTMEDAEYAYAMKVIGYAEGGRRKYIDLDEEFFTSAGLYNKSYSFVYPDKSGDDTSYYIAIRKENPILGEYTWMTQGLIGLIFPPAVPITVSGKTILPYQYHVTITRVRDNAVMYNGSMLDLTAFEMIDPNTNTVAATLQYSAFWSRIFIE